MLQAKKYSDLLINRDYTWKEIRLMLFLMILSVLCLFKCYLKQSWIPER